MIVDLDKIFAAVCIAYIWSLLDKIRFNYPTTIFSRLGGAKAQLWLDPKQSQPNKWRFKPVILDLLFSTCFVWLTDLWHLVKMILLVTIFYFLWSVHIPQQKLWIDLIMMFVCYGIVFELNYQMDWFWWLKAKDKK